MFIKIQLAVYSFMLLLFSQLLSQDFDTLFLKPGPDVGKDVLLRSIYPNLNEGDHHDFMAAAWTAYNESFISRALIEFNLNLIPEDATIVDAKLSLFYSEQTGGVGNSGENASYLLKIMEPWNEHIVTWETQPSVSYVNPVYLPASISQYQDYLGIDVTDLISDLYNYPNTYHGFMFRLINEEIYRSLTFSSSDQINPVRWPELTVVYVECEQPIPEFTYSIDEDLDIVFINLSQNYDSCFWDFGNGYYSSEENPTIQYLEEGVYIVELTVFNYCSQNSLSDTICYYQDLINTFEYEINDKEVTFTSLAENAISYIWDFGDGFMSTLENPTHTYNDYSDYHVCLTVEHTCDVTIYCDSVKVISPDGINETRISSISVYPNPFQDVISIINSGSVDFLAAEMSLYNSNGVKIFSKPISLYSSSDYKVKMDGISSGVYTLILQSDELIVLRKLFKL